MEVSFRGESFGIWWAWDFEFPLLPDFAHRRNRRRFRSKNRLILRKIRASRYASLIPRNQMKS